MSPHRPARRIISSIPITRWKPAFKKKSSRGQRGALCPNLPKSSILLQKFNIDRKYRFRYQFG
jgi:hypothetical protein